MTALIIYHTKTGHTRRAAEDIAEGLREAGVESRIVAAREFGGWDVGEEIVLVGSPCHAGSCHIRGGLSGPVRAVLKRLGASDLAGKVAGAFAVNCAIGGGLTVKSIEKALARAGARIAEPGVVVRAGVPFSLTTGPMASPDARERLRRFGGALAQAAAASPEQAAPQEPSRPTEVTHDA